MEMMVLMSENQDFSDCIKYPWLPKCNLPESPDSLPGCLGLDKPLFPNKCESCKFTEICKGMVKKNL